jgi:hypothetical protein
MIGETAFSLGVLHGGGEGSVELLRQWERFALPMPAAPSTGAGGPVEGRLIDVAGECMLSGIRRVEGTVQVRLWNPLEDRPATASVENVHRTVPPAAIVTIPSRGGVARRADAS